MEITDNRTRNRILLILFFGVLMGALDIAVVGPALPAIQSSFAVDERALAWVFSIYVLFNLISVPLMAKLSDALGRRSIYIFDILIFAIGSLTTALSPNFAILLVGRAIQGFGAGGIFPVASAVIGDTFPPEKRGSALGLIGAVFGLAFLVGPLLGVLILRFGSWPWLFIINLPIAAAIIIYAYRLLPAARPKERRPFDLAGMAVISLSLAALTYGINQLDTDQFVSSLTSTAVWPFLLAAIVLLVLFRSIERSADDPVLRMRLFASKQIIVLGGVALGAGLGEAAIVFVPSLLVDAFGVSNSTASAMLLPAVLAMMLGAPLAGRMLDQMGSRVVVLFATGALALGMIAVGTIEITRVLFYLCAVLIGLGLGMLLGAPLRYIMLNEAPVEDRAAGQGALSLFTSTGQLIGGALVGAIVASLGGGVSGYQSAYLVVGFISVALFLIALNLKNRADEQATVRRNEAAQAAAGH